MKKGFVALLFCVLCALAAPPRAAAMYVSAEELARRCISEKKEDIYACVFYIAGVIDYHTVLQSLGTAPTISFCIPSSITKEQAAVVVVAYLRTAPQHDAFIAATSIPMALNKAFPCKPPAPRRRK